MILKRDWNSWPSFNLSTAKPSPFFQLSPRGLGRAAALRHCRSLRTHDAKRSSPQNRAGHWAINTRPRVIAASLGSSSLLLLKVGGVLQGSHGSSPVSTGPGLL